MRQHLRGLGADTQIDLAADQVLVRRPAAAIRHELDAVPVTFWKWMPLTWPGLPAPTVAAVALSGLAFSQSTRSFSVGAGSCRPTITVGATSSIDTGSRSVRMS